MRDIETLVIKQIFKNPDGTSGKIIEYATKELAYSILPNDVIDAKYKAGITPYFQKEEENLPGEEWRQHEKTKLQVSNFGRIKTPDGTLQKQQNKQEKQKEIIGYLELADWKKVEKCLGFKFSALKLEYIYQLVAETWLEKDEKGQKEFEGRWEVHHITNNGYDNRPENLIWLKHGLHQKIHSLNFNRQ